MHFNLSGHPFQPFKRVFPCSVFGAAKSHCVYLFANRRATRVKVLVHDGIGVWLAARDCQRSG